MTGRREGMEGVIEAFGQCYEITNMDVYDSEMSDIPFCKAFKMD